MYIIKRKSRELLHKTFVYVQMNRFCLEELMNSQGIKHRRKNCNVNKNVAADWKDEMMKYHPRAPTSGKKEKQMEVKDTNCSTRVRKGTVNAL